MDLLEKTTNGLKIVEFAKSMDMYPFFRSLEGSRGNNVIFQERELVMMGSNNYLGLTHHPKVIEASIEAVRQWGTGCTGSRFLNGNLVLHEQLEAELADFFGYEAAIVFATGYMANEGAITALASKEDEHIFSDEENHACIIQGCKLAKAQIHVFRHDDMKHLEELLKSVPVDAGKMIISDGVFSMTGHLARYDVIHQLAKKYNARTYIDDAHAIGVVGEGGRGTANHYGLKADFLMGTFSKTLGSQGGFVCADAKTVEWIRHKAKSFMFSAALAPACTAAARQALTLLREHPEMVQHVRDNAAYLKNNFDEMGLNTMGTQTCVVPVLIGNDQAALAICQELLAKGIFTTPVVYPAVPRGQAVIRCSVMATHTKDDLNRAIDAFGSLLEEIKYANTHLTDDGIIELLDGVGDVEHAFDQASTIHAKPSKSK